MKRPLGFVALLYGGGLLLAEFFPSPLLPLFALSFGLTALALAISSARKFLIWPLILCVGWTNMAWRTSILSPYDLRVTQGNFPEIVSVRATLVETPSTRVFVNDEQETWHTLARVQVNTLHRHGIWQPAFGQVLVSTAGILPEQFHSGRTVEITGVLAPPPLPLAEGLFDFQAHLKRQEIYFQLKAESSNDWKIIEPLHPSVPLPDRFRTWAGKALMLGLPVEDESSKLERALTLGDKSVLTDEISEPFVRAATYHIFAVDGLRMAIIFGIFFSLLRVIGVPRAWCGLALLPLLWFYTALTGWPASAIRATVMLSIIIGGWIFKRPGDLLNSLFAAALVILVWDPQQLFQAGFQLRICEKVYELELMVGVSALRIKPLYELFSTAR